MPTILDKVKNALDQGYDLFKDNASVLLDKAEDFGKINKLKVEIWQLSSSVEKKLAVLGDAVFPHLLKNNVEALKDNPAIKLILEEIKELNTQIDDKQKKVDELVVESKKVVKEKEEEKMQKKIELIEKEIEERMAILNELKKEEK